MSTAYDTDFYAWALEQAAFLRKGSFSAIDTQQLAEEIESMALHERRRLRHRMIQLVMHLMKWRYQSERRGNSWKKSISFQRREIQHELGKMPSLRHELSSEWFMDIWAQAANKAEAETHLTNLPTRPIWSMDEVFDDDFFPDADEATPVKDAGASRPFSGG